jgi:NADPH:quinone reductase-like Zn-dependent oxidoreductase
MKALVQDRYGTPDVLELRDVTRPALRPDDVLVEVRAAGVDPGVWIVTTGRPYAVRPVFGLRRPKVAARGRDLAGVVAAVGANVTRFTAGDEVYGTCETGSFAEFAAARQNRLAPKPAGLTFEQAAAIPVSGQTALQAVRGSGRVRAGDEVMVIGAAGGVGSFAVQIAKARGARVTAVCRGKRADFVRSLGADDVIDYEREPIDRDGPRFDVAIDCGGDRPFSVVRKALKPRGTHVLVGGSYDRGRLLSGYQRILFGVPLASMVASQRIVALTSKETAEDLVELTRLVESGAVTPAVHRIYPLPAAPEAIREVNRRPPGKLVVTI